VKLGSEDSKKTKIAIGLAVLALILTARMLYTNFSSSGQAAAPAPANQAVAPTPARPVPGRRGRAAQQSRTTGPTLNTSLDPRLNLKLLNETESMQYDGNGRNIFKSNAEEAMAKIPVAVATALKKQPEQPIAPGPPPPPLPPPIPLKFFGFATQQGGKKVLLLSGDDVFVATEGEIVQRRYKIMKINANNIEVMDVLSNNKQTIPLTAG
jgi:hypothetical protein